LKFTISKISKEPIRQIKDLKVICLFEKEIKNGHRERLLKYPNSEYFIKCISNNQTDTLYIRNKSIVFEHNFYETKNDLYEILQIDNSAK